MPTIVSFQDAINNRPGDLIIYIDLFALWTENCVKGECFWRFRFIATRSTVDRNCATHFINLTNMNPTDTTKNTCILYKDTDRQPFDGLFSRTT